MATLLSSVFFAASALGLVYGLLTIVAARRLMAVQAPFPAPVFWPSVTVLKPLYGAEPSLEANLASFLSQDYPGKVEFVFGVASVEDGALPIVERLRARFPAASIAIVIDAANHGRNRKVSNLLNMDRGRQGEIVVLADSDMRVAPDYLRRLVETLSDAKIGAVSLLYRGRSEDGLAARLSALGIDAHFLPSAALSIAFGLATPCFGSTIALKRQVLTRIGGFARLADELADDYALGRAVRELGLRVVFPPLIVEHSCHEADFAALWAHDLRWARTVRIVNPMGYLGSIITHPLPLALFGVLFAGASPMALSVFTAVIAVRGATMHWLGRIFGLERASLPLLLLRDFWSFLVFVWSFFDNSVDWRGYRLEIGANGQINDPRSVKNSEAQSKP